MQKALAPEIGFGMDVELTMIPFTTDSDGDEIVTFAFEPKGSAK